MIIEAQNKCISLVCSCYVPSRNSDIKEEEEEENNSSSSKNQSFAENKIGSGSESELREEQEINNNRQEKIINGSSNYYNGGWSDHVDQHSTTLKSNLKRSSRDNEQKRKVSWPDAYGKDIDLVHEFEESLSKDEELEGVRISCVCTIQ